MLFANRDWQDQSNVTTMFFVTLLVESILILILIQLLLSIGFYWFLF